MIGQTFYAIEDAFGRVMADASTAVIFSDRYSAEECMAQCRRPGARIVQYGGDHDVVSFMERIASQGARAILINPGRAGQALVPINPGAWTSQGRMRAHAKAANLHLAG